MVQPSRPHATPHCPFQARDLGAPRIRIPGTMVQAGSYACQSRARRVPIRPGPTVRPNAQRRRYPAPRREREATATEHRLGLGFGWRLEGSRRERFELRFEGARANAPNDDGESRIGLRITASWLPSRNRRPRAARAPRSSQDARAPGRTGLPARAPCAIRWVVVLGERPDSERHAVLHRFQFRSRPPGPRTGGSQ